MARKQKKSAGGRPPIPAEQQYSERLWTNLTPEMKARLDQYRVQNGISSIADAIRQLVVKSLKAEQLL